MYVYIQYIFPSPVGGGGRGRVATKINFHKNTNTIILFFFVRNLLLFELFIGFLLIVTIQYTLQYNRHIYARCLLPLFKLWEPTKIGVQCRAANLIVCTI
jgi:hypothetical protein